MPKNWFTSFEGPAEDWDPTKHDYSELFVKQLLALRERFDLTPESKGVDVGTHSVLHYANVGGEFRIFVRTLNWAGKGEWLVREPPVISPILRIQMSVLVPSAGNWVEIFDDEITIAFPETFPCGVGTASSFGRPQIRLSNLWTGPFSLRENQILCVMARTGQWNSEKHTAVRAVEVAAHWVVRNWQSGNLKKRTNHGELPEENH